MAEKNCTKCGELTDVLAVFPGGICLDCYRVTPEANAPLTAEGLANMWGASALPVREIVWEE